MKEQFDPSLFYKKQAAPRRVILIAVHTLLLIGALAALLVNTAGMNRQLQKNVERYAGDVSAQLAGNISSRMKMREIYIRNLADTFSGMPGFLMTEELLNRKAEYLGMDGLFLLNEDGSTFPEGINELHPELTEYLSVRPDLYQEPHIFHSDHNEIFFSAPVFWKDGSGVSALAGVCSNAAIQQMLLEVDFKDQGLCCIVDSSGTVVVAATDETPFLELNDIFKEGISEEDAGDVLRVQEDIDAGRSGVVYFDNVGSKPVMLGYDFLGINDWMMLTLISTNLFSEETAPYLGRYIAIICFMALVMLNVILTFAHYYRRSLRYIQSVALTDPLTGERNYLAFQVEGEKLLREHSEQGYAILYLNLRNFKRFNMRFGVKKGDRLLQQIGLLLSGSLQEDELLSRSEGDHFYLLLKCSDEEEVRQRLKGILEQLERQLSFDRADFNLGAYLIRRKDTDILILADRAKIAGSYQGENDICRFYDDALSQKLKRERALDESFRRAIENREFQLYIQPKVRPGQTKKKGGEVLVRWQHPQFGLLFPGDFIPLFERSGKVCDLDFYMFEETCRLLKDWLKKGTAVPLSVNLSRAHLISDDISFLDRFKETKEAYQIPDGLIELELTETLALERRELSTVAAIIDRIRSMGFLCSMDDFGFGYSSLALLKNFNVSTIKLDRQFFLDESEKSWIVVSRLIRLAHDLCINVVAEGIEDFGQVDKLRQYGCDLIQGYVYARPMPAADFESWIFSQETASF